MRRGASILEPRPRWLRRLAREVVAGYHRPPADRPRELAAYVELVLDEVPSRRPPPRVRRWLAFEPQMARAPWPVPELPSPGDVAAWLGADDTQLAWLADVRGLERSVADRRRARRASGWGTTRPACAPAPPASSSAEAS